MSPKGKRAKAGPVPVEEIDHDETRANIPTEELRDFVADEESSPPDQLYPRDSSLDPQLVWKGKDEQDREDLSVPTVPIYIQETVRPQAIIENLRETAAEGEEEPELTLFDDLRSLEFKDLVDFYSHADRWTNRLILGDSLLVMNSLAEKERLRGKVQTIYIDPPYGIKFGSNWQVSTRKRDVKDGKATDATRQPEQVKAFRDTWELGIHSYLSYLRDRLVVSRELLTESGSCFVQIGDENVHLVRALLDEVFGAENFVSQITVQKSGSTSSNLLPNTTDFILWYARSRDAVKFHALREKFDMRNLDTRNWRWILEPDGTERPMTPEERRNPASIPDGAVPFRFITTTSQSYSSTRSSPIEIEGGIVSPGSDRHWSVDPGLFGVVAAAGRLRRNGSNLEFKRLLSDFGIEVRKNIWLDTGRSGFGENQIYVVQTNTKIIERCFLMTTDPGDLVLDPTCGSGTTAVVAEKNGRRWITIDTSRVSVALARTRIMAALHPAYLLADSPDGQAKEFELGGAQPAGGTRRDIRKGFVYKRVPHITLKSIAQNPDIKEGMSREEIDVAIAKHADQELLYDQPYENKKAVRVAGPFTVESLSPHRMLDFDPDRKTETDEPAESSAPFTTTILENLKRAGVQNTVRDEHLDFTSLEPFAGRYIHMRGEYEQKAGEVRSVAVSLGPERGTVGADWVNQAAKEALKGAGCDLLLVCAFAFDGHASEEAREFAPDEAADTFAVGAVEEKLGKLPILLVRMNPDLDMGEDLLKKTGSGNLFMVFGEPDILIEDVSDNEIEVEIRGLDVYDPTTGQVRSDSTDDIACWFIDTNYNEESFFVRHAYFTGGDNPYDKLKRALRADIDEEAWASLNRTRSRPFPRPESGRIAVKVINHYGDEILKTYEIEPVA